MHHENPQTAGLVTNEFVAFSGGACGNCVFWIEKLGCCRSDCERFRSMIPVENCQAWKPMSAGKKLTNVTFSSVPWLEPARRIA